MKCKTILSDINTMTKMSKFYPFLKKYNSLLMEVAASKTSSLLHCSSRGLGRGSGSGSSVGSSGSGCGGGLGLDVGVGVRLPGRWKEQSK